MSQTAEIFTIGRSQEVRLSAAYCFETNEVLIRRDAETGDVILSHQPTTWDVFSLRWKALMCHPISLA